LKVAIGNSYESTALKRKYSYAGRSSRCPLWSTALCLLDSDAREAVVRARAVVDALVEKDEVAYAITTGVGKLSDVHIKGDQIRELQINLVRSHCVGVGEPLSIEETRAMMVLRANSLAKGFSGIRPVRWIRSAKC